MSFGEFVVVPPPPVVYRVSRWPGDPFSPPPWEIARTDGTFGNRFDDPGTGSLHLPDSRYRVISCATQRVAAFGETLAVFRPSVGLLAMLRKLPDETPFNARDYGATSDPDHAEGLVPESWRARRQCGTTTLHPSLRFVDIAAATTLSTLREALAAKAVELGFFDLDLSAVVGHNRSLTQACSRFIHEQKSDDGKPLFAGIRYVSRLHVAWECWAVFDDRMWHEPKGAERVQLDDPDLQEAANVLRLNIQLS